MRSIREFVETTKGLYEENDFPSDRLVRTEGALLGFAAELARRVGEPFTKEEVAEEIERIRKSKSSTGGLPKVGRSFSGPKFVAELRN